MSLFKSKEKKLRERFEKVRVAEKHHLPWSMLPDERKELAFQIFCEEVRKGRNDKSAAEYGWIEAFHDTPLEISTKPVGPPESYDMTFMITVDQKQKALGLQRTFGPYFDLGKRYYPIKPGEVEDLSYLLDNPFYNGSEEEDEFEGIYGASEEDSDMISEEVPSDTDDSGPDIFDSMFEVQENIGNFEDWLYAKHGIDRMEYVDLDGFKKKELHDEYLSFVYYRI